MEFAEWEPVYEAILAEFGYGRDGDERARDALGAAYSGTPPDPPGGGTVAVAGAGPSLPAELDRAAAADRVYAASTAATTLRDHGVGVDAMVTDLDKNPGTAVALTRRGTPVAVHAHGDNVAAVEEHVPAMDHDCVVPTTQAAPHPPVRNFGGFTDGDRAAFLADHAGADALVFPGWDFEDPSVGAEKRRKLRWAARLLRWLELRRDERFAVLEGRREGLLDALPIDEK
ncbi:MAG: 6-hydroxymethylpterin diphosphokinase MptE-like protein [Halobacteriaceae archaeon]